MVSQATLCLETHESALGFSLEFSNMLTQIKNAQKKRQALEDQKQSGQEVDPQEVEALQAPWPRRPRISSGSFTKNIVSDDNRRPSTSP